MSQPNHADFEKLLAFRVTLRRFQHWSETQARAAGLTHVQHQLLVAVKGHPGAAPPTIGDVARYLLLRHHSAVELVDRAQAAGLVRRTPDARDARVVRVSLTTKGNRLVTRLAESTLAELHKLTAVLNELGSPAMAESESALAADAAAGPDEPPSNGHAAPAQAADGAAGPDEPPSNGHAAPAQAAAGRSAS